ncbi:hypothetical protein ACA910_012572 [Epithemia clementina (nom. ined.)]
MEPPPYVRLLLGYLDFVQLSPEVLAPQICAHPNQPPDSKPWINTFNSFSNIPYAHQREAKAKLLRTGMPINVSIKPHFSGKRERLEVKEGYWMTTMMATTTSASSLIPHQQQSIGMEDLLDQLKALLEREEKYAREDYIGCFPEDLELPIVPGEDSNAVENAKCSSNVSIYTRRTKQSKTRKNSSVNSKDSRKSFFSEQHRARLCEWAMEVVKYYNFPMLAVEVTMNILDRYLAKFVPPHERTMDTLHLFTLTSLYLALKLTTPERPAPHIFVRLSRSKFTVQDVEQAEMIIVQGLNWHVNPPVAEIFVSIYIQVLSEAYPQELWQRVEASTIDSIRTTTADYVWVRFLPSVIAMGALSLSLHQESMGSPDRYPSPLAELHRRGIYVNQMGSMQCLEYLYLRAMYASTKAEDRPDLSQQLMQNAKSASAKNRTNSNESPTRNTSPVSILKQDPVVIADEED